MKYEERPFATSLYRSNYKLNNELSNYSKPSIDSDKGFRLLKKIFIFFSINLFDPSDSKFKKIRNLLRLATLMHIFIIYLVLVEIRSYARLKTPIGLNISLSSGTVIVVILRIILLKQATLVRKTLKTSYEMLYTITTRGLLATDHVILNHGQVTWTTPELATPSPNYHTPPTQQEYSLKSTLPRYMAARVLW
ncbi:uncharacterized protein TNCV_1256441 [Trichonephila clavipes]|nr:uncharacterized protein TNCV_1256441 [Trichonephila clavipes]